MAGRQHARKEFNRMTLQAFAQNAKKGLVFFVF